LSLGGGVHPEAGGDGMGKGRQCSHLVEHDGLVI
jgi:hypothetical protein